jgi:DNA-binding NtrC family response regulator
MLVERYRELASAATSNVPIEITGETGTGKELAARAVHAHWRALASSSPSIGCHARS